MVLSQGWLGDSLKTPRDSLDVLTERRWVVPQNPRDSLQLRSDISSLRDSLEMEREALTNPRDSPKHEGVPQVGKGNARESLMFGGVPWIGKGIQRESLIFEGLPLCLEGVPCQIIISEGLPLFNKSVHYRRHRPEGVPLMYAKVLTQIIPSFSI